MSLCCLSHRSIIKYDYKYRYERRYPLRYSKLENELEMLKTLKKVWNVFTTVLVALVVIVAILLVGIRLIGFDVFTVLSGSMEPTYHTGSVIYVKDVDYRQLEAGDVITFMLDEDTIATHRIVEVVPDDEDPAVLRYRTKGDANEAEDGSLVHYKNVVGSPVFSIPYLGYVANYIQEPPGTYVAISAGAILLILVFLPDLFAEEKPKKKAEGEEEPEETSEAPAKVKKVKPAKERKPARKKGGKYLKK